MLSNLDDSCRSQTFTSLMVIICRGKNRDEGHVRAVVSLQITLKVGPDL